MAAGYEVLAENYTVRGAEIDLIAKDGELLLVVEVRQRASSHYGSAAESITFAKLKRLQHAALHFMAAHYARDDLPLRFDALLIEGTRDAFAITHVQGIV